ncbi:MAG TPA: DUF1573 domain-containing protein [Phycisphaerae bacterium]|nr:DUF1573 domain-containing protein [Phycisphaerae bacterium]HRW52076.1 DUF1573 domain-containing protein [Phycisphaerae bacterium]
MTRNGSWIRRTLGVVAALALVAGSAASPVRAQSETEKSDTKTPNVAKTEDLKEKAQQKPAKISPRPARKSGLTIPEPTVVLKPGELPAIKFDEPNYDFGRIRAGEDVVHTYWFTNTGNGPLEILRVKPSCGCTKAGDHTKVVQPGETGQIPIKLSTKKGGNTISKTVTVNTNIPGQDGTIRLTIKGNVWQPVEVSPNNASFGRLTQAKISTESARRLTIVNNVTGSMTISNVRCDNPRFKAEVKPIEEGKKYELVVEIVPPLLEGNNRGLIKFDTGLAEYPTVDVAAFAYVTSPVDVTPSALTLIPERTGVTKRQFYVRSNDGVDFEIKNVKSSSGKLVVSSSALANGKNTYQLVVDIPADFSPAADEMIEFETTHPAAPKLSIPVRSRGVVTRKAPPQVAHPAKPAAKAAVEPAKPAEPAATKKSDKTGEMKPVN